MADQLNDPMVLQNIISRNSPAVLLALEPSQLNDAAFLHGVLNRITAAPAPTQSEPAPAETQSHLSIPQTISSGLLSESDELEFFVQELPFDTSPGPTPFIGCIINLNVTSDGHLDIKDRDLCAIMPFAEWEGGQIVFYQLDIFANLNPLDIVIFPSNHITHFNFCHKHKHGSVVTSTDKGFDAWIKDENGYAGENFGVGVFKQSNVLVVAE
ncbi:hypothetical protein C8J56DRAFT_1068796 [Mycena floridula]|nr:hypothetical protein C8J56DRAFT_1068796 [Mycena floridula]